MARRFSKAILIAVVMCMLSVMLIAIASGNASNDDSQINQLIQMSKAGKSTDKIIETARKNGFAIIDYRGDVVTLEGKEIWENFVSNCEAGIPGSVKIASMWYDWDDNVNVHVGIREYIFADGKYSIVVYTLPSGEAEESDQYSRLVSYYNESVGYRYYFLTDSDIDVDSFESDKDFERAVYRDELSILLSFFYAD